MKKILFAASVLVAAVTAPAAATAASTCITFGSFCDAMQFDGKKSASWHNYDCGGSVGKQTKANYKKGTTICDGAKGCNPSAAYGWEFLNWKFNKAASTGTLTGVSGGVEYVLQQDLAVTYTAGACSVAAKQGGVSSLAN